MNLNSEQPHSASDDSEVELSVFCDLPLFVDGELNDEAREKYLTNATQAFRDSEWALQTGEGNAWRVRTFLDLALTHIGVSADNMRLHDALEVLLELYPRKVSESADRANEIIDALVGFWTFCDRVHHFKQAATIADKIASVRDEFHDAMDDSGNFGPAKHFYMAGLKAGYDMTNEDSVNSFMMHYNLNRMAALNSARYDEPEENQATMNVPKDLKQRKKLLKKLKRK